MRILSRLWMIGLIQNIQSNTTTINYHRTHPFLNKLKLISYWWPTLILISQNWFHNDARTQWGRPKILNINIAVLQENLSNCQASVLKSLSFGFILFFLDEQSAAIPAMITLTHSIGLSDRPIVWTIIYSTWCQDSFFSISLFFFKREKGCVVRWSNLFVSSLARRLSIFLAAVYIYPNHSTKFITISACLISQWKVGNRWKSIQNYRTCLILL